MYLHTYEYKYIYTYNVYTMYVYVYIHIYILYYFYDFACVSRDIDLLFVIFQEKGNNFFSKDSFSDFCLVKKNISFLIILK